MTTTVNVHAQCGPEKEVIIQHSDPSGKIIQEVLQDNELSSTVVYDGIMCVVFEREKPRETDDPNA